jgi:hypothetical protein
MKLTNQIPASTSLMPTAWPAREVLSGGDFDGMRQSPQQALANLASSPGWFLAPGCDDCRFYWFGQLIGIAKGSASAIAQAFQATLLIAFEDLVIGLPNTAAF